MTSDTPPATGGNITHHISYDDLRDWIAEADRLGELRHVSGATWQEDMGMAAGILSHRDDGPAVLFDDVPGFAKGFRVLVNIFAGTRQNMSLGFPASLDKVELSHAFAEIYNHDTKLIPPVTVSDGPVMENVLIGDDVDLEIFPTPLWHEKDGGRYIGTGSYNVTRDPDEDWVNLGVYRIMVKDKNTVGHNVLPGRHAAYHLEKYVAKGEPMPMLMVVGGDPLAFFVGAFDVPEGTCEYDVVGGLRGKPVEVVHGKLTGLPFPANAEIVLEGYVHAEQLEVEGPFGDWTGTYTEKGRVNPVVEIKAIYHRNDPILLGFVPQFLPDEFSRYRAITRSALLKQNIEAAGVPDVVEVWAHEIGGSRMLTGISIRQRYAGHSKQAAHIASQCQVGVDGNRWVIVTDDDIDVTNLEELIWAALTRAEPGVSIDLVSGAKAAQSHPRITPGDRAVRNFTASRLISDACVPYHWRDEFPEINKASPEHIRKSWDKFGYLFD